MNNIIDLFKKQETVTSIIEKTKGLNYSLFCNGLTDNTKCLLSASIFDEIDKFVFYICENSYKANVVYDTLCTLLGYEKVNLYVTDDIHANEADVISKELTQERFNSIKNIVENNKVIIVTHIQAILKPVISFNNFKSNIYRLEKGKTLKENFVNYLISIGYERVHTTYHLGEFSLRGEVIDIFPCTSQKPIRINTSFDDIESIRYFDLESQLTTENISNFDLYPMYEYPINFDKEKFVSLIEKTEEIKVDLNNIFENNCNNKLSKYIKYFDENNSIILNYLDNKNYITLFDNIDSIKEAYEVCVNEGNELFNKILPNNKLDLVNLYDIEFLLNTTKNNLYLSNIKKALSGMTFSNIFEINSYETIDYNNDLPYFCNDLKTNNNDTIVTFKNENRLNLISEFLKENNVKFNVIKSILEFKKGINLTIVDNALSYGLFNNYRVISEQNIFKNIKKKKTHYRSVTETNIQITNKDELKPGDYVVHFDYGIGKYLGIKTSTFNDITNDYLQIQYENMVLLVPMEKITDLEKYIGAEGVVPKLTKIGTNEWEKKKKNVSDQLEIIAKDLIDLQIKREQLQGVKYSKDSSLQIDFENDFTYEETLDQKRIVSEIKKDMEKGVLIDRLVCGDVGFGKTEIAMRIAFKTVYEGKQVAYLAPTTILTKQHYLTFKDRFEKYGIKVALLNRMVDEKEQKRVIQGLKDGSCDIVIGTHRLLNDEIVYKDLGLLVVDEEQRFGVTHKEKIKRIKNNINVLTLTATPIPRTLQMAVTGIRTLSLLETPPKDRYPIQTYVVEKNDAIIKEAIYRELSRKGQVFYLHNRISDIEKVAKHIEKLVPEANVCIGHGKMTREELEDVFSSFIDKKYNVLLCTTIIETGVDIPNSNTLIVDNSNRLGLSQMYQIRGRVGRTDRIAYAYFMYEPDTVLEGQGRKRLDAIKEYSKVGSGYKIAVRDLAIRGAGDILGKEQSGFINSLGMDMYMKLLNQAVDKAKGIEKPKKINYRIDISKHVEKNYVSDDTIIIYIHKEINAINSKIDKEKTINELTNRFGRLSNNVLDYIEERYLESNLRKMTITKVIEQENLVTIYIPKDISSNLNGEKVLMTGYRISERFSFEFKNGCFVIILTKDNNDKSWLYLANEFFEKII